MAGTIIADVIRTDANQLSLNVGNTTFATFNAAGFFSNTGTQLIAANGKVSGASLVSGSITSAAFATAANTIPRSSMTSGAVLQVVSATTSTGASTSTATYLDSNLTASITPSSATSKVLVLFHQNGCSRGATNNTTGFYLRLLRGATEIFVPAQDWAYTNTNLAFIGGTISGAYLDSPSTTSSTTYKTQFKPGVTGLSTSVQESSSVSVITLLEIGA